MKKLTIVAITLFSILSCVKDEYSGSQKDLTGEWLIQNVYFEGEKVDLTECGKKQVIIVDEEGDAKWKKPFYTNPPCNLTTKHFLMFKANGVHFDIIDSDDYLKYYGEFSDKNNIKIRIHQTIDDQIFKTTCTFKRVE